MCVERQRGAGQSRSELSQHGTSSYGLRLRGAGQTRWSSGCSAALVPGRGDPSIRGLGAAGDLPGQLAGVRRTHRGRSADGLPQGGPA